MKHFIAVTLLVAILTAGVGIGLTETGLFPEQASVQAEPIDTLFQMHIWAIAFLFSLIVGFMLYSIIVFRRKGDDDSDGDYFTGHTGLEVIWTIVPLATVVFFAVIGAQFLGEVLQPAPDPLEVDVVGSQWSWRFDYEEYGFSSTELRLPVNKQALLTLSSTDVIHSFWVPEFRVKQDALPGEGMERELRITPKKVGEFTARCAELCGTRHAYMTAPVIVMEPGDFDAWVQEQQTELPTDPVARGEQWSQEFGCTACHSTDGSESVGPTWAGLFGSQETLADGTTVEVGAEYLEESIRDPQAKLVAEFEDVVMPNVSESMTAEQIQDIIAFIESLSE